MNRLLQGAALGATRLVFGIALLGCVPLLAYAQSSPFMTGATALQTNILAWLTPIAIILVMALGAMAMANRMQLKMEQRGLRSELAERLRAEYRQRLQQRGAHVAAAPAAAAAQEKDLETIRRQAREAWLRIRPGATPGTGGERPAPEREAQRATPGSEEDLSR